MTISFGLKTNTHVFICSQTVADASILKIKEDYNYVSDIAGVLACITGEQCDTFRMALYLEQYTKLLALQYRERVVPELVARLMAAEVHYSLRSNPSAVQGIVAGRSADNTLRLFGVDRYGALHEDNFVVTGYGLYFLFGIYDMEYRREMGEEEGMKLIQDCLKVLRERLVLDTEKWKVDVIGPEGHKEVKLH